MLPSWAVVLSLSLLVLGVAWGLVMLHDAGAQGRATQYRSRYQRLVLELERLVSRANKLYGLSERTKDAALLDHYHSIIKMIETLIEAVRKIRGYGNDKDLLVAPLFLVKDVSEKLERLETAMLQVSRGKPHQFMKAAAAMAHQAIGCYFCSRPFDAQIFSKVRVKIENKSSEVASCSYCREKLLLTKKARVLFFSENDQQVHWSKAKSWTPSPEYWNINRENIGRSGRLTHLELVYSNGSHTSNIDDQTDDK